MDLRLADGLFSSPISRYYRSSDRGFAVGERHDVAGLEVEIRKLAGPGDPTLVRYRFPVPLEDSTLRWLAFQERAYVPFSPPGIGESVTLSPGKGIFEID